MSLPIKSSASAYRYLLVASVNSDFLWFSKSFLTLHQSFIGANLSLTWTTIHPNYLQRTPDKCHLHTKSFRCFYTRVLKLFEYISKSKGANRGPWTTPIFCYIIPDLASWYFTYCWWLVILYFISWSLILLTPFFLSLLIKISWLMVSKQAE